MTEGVRDAILDLALRRGLGKSLCPSEAAKTLEPEDWQALMPEVRRAAAGMPEILATQGGVAVNPVTARGADPAAAPVGSPDLPD